MRETKQNNTKPSGSQIQAWELPPLPSSETVFAITEDLESWKPECAQTQSRRQGSMAQISFTHLATLEVSISFDSGDIELIALNTPERNTLKTRCQNRPQLCLLQGALATNKIRKRILLLNWCWEES